MLSIQKRGGVRILLYGAGQGGGFAVREMRLNPDRRMDPVGFLDDDPMKKGASTYGLTVHGDLSCLHDAVRKTRAEQVVIVSSSISTDRATDILLACRALGFPCTRMTFEFDSDISQGDGFRSMEPKASVNA